MLERRRHLNAERSEAIERHEVPLELLNAATRLSITTSWCSNAAVQLYQKLEAGRCRDRLRPV